MPSIMMYQEDLSSRPQEGDPFVLCLIVRGSLEMSAGKVAAQCSHAVQMMLLSYTELERRLATGATATASDLARLEGVRAWLKGIYRKVVLTADDAEWCQIKESLDGFLVKDVGFTEVAAGAETAIALWPMRKSVRPRITAIQTVGGGRAECP